MRYKVLGTSGVRVSELCLGTMTFGDDWQFGATEDVSRSIFDEFCAAGGNFVDTANTYTYGTSESLVGKFIASDRDYFIVSTKYSLSTRPTDPNGGGNHRKNMIRSVENSLRALRTDYIDVFWVHVWDGVTATADVMRGLDDLIRSGKIRYAGVSDTPAWVVSRANTLAALRGWSPFIAMQTEYSLIERTPERDLLPMADALDLCVLAWAPLGGGILTGKYELRGDEVHIGDSKRGGWLNGERLHVRNLRIAATVSDVARELGVTPSQLALAWIRRQLNAPIPIIAGRTVEQIRENIGCIDCGIDDERLQRLNDASAIELGFPHVFLSYDPLRAALHGDRRNLFDEPNRRSGVVT
ncbi:MAG: aldo/keto reductase [Candidatus Eremiobacteraeota bacterium]|nr:aldo/keto reductase [Candidatus Eremiobacteraeota bacterium]